MTTQALPKGVMIFSLDLELAWGTRGRPSAAHVGPYLDGTRYAIDRLLTLFEDHEVPATWAIVGSLLLGRGTDDSHDWLSDDRFRDVPRGNSITEPRWYAEDILRSIQECSTTQEIGCHTLTHLYVDPTPAGREAFREELRRFRQLFDQLLLEQPITFIYPKAMMGHFDVLAEEGFRCFRGPEPRWYESLPGVHLPAAIRVLDGKLALTPNVSLPQLTKERLWMLPSSQFYSPRMSVGRHVTVAQRVRKACEGLRKAALDRGIFHLWTHPFNLGQSTDELIEGLDAILREARQLRDEDRLEIVSMGELAMQLDRESEAIHAALPQDLVDGSPFARAR